MSVQQPVVVTPPPARNAFGNGNGATTSANNYRSPAFGSSTPVRNETGSAFMFGAKTPEKSSVDLSAYDLCEKNSTPIRTGYKPHGVFTKDDEQYVVYTGKGNGYSYFHKIMALDGSVNIQQTTPSAKHMETCEKF
jgi:hypothetical protein